MQNQHNPLDQIIRNIKNAPSASSSQGSSNVSRPNRRRSPHWLNRQFSLTLTVGQLGIILLLFLLLFGLLVSSISSSLSHQNSIGNNQNNQATNQQPVPTPSPTDTPTPLPTATPTLEPTPTPTPMPTPVTSGTILYQSSSDNWQSWGIDGSSGHWRVQGTSLLNDGNGTPPLFTQQYIPQGQNVPDYKVVAKITLIRLNNTDHSSFGIIARATSDQGGYSFSICHQRGIVFGMLVPCAGQTITEALLLKGQNFPDGNPVLGHSTFQPEENREYTYEIEVKGYTISVFIDNRLLFPPVNDLTYSSGGSVGIWSVDCQISVSSLEIIAA